MTELFEIGDALEKNIRFLEDYMNGPGGNAGPAELRKLLNWMIAEKHGPLTRAMLRPGRGRPHGSATGFNSFAKRQMAQQMRTLHYEQRIPLDEIAERFHLGTGRTVRKWIQELEDTGSVAD